MVMVMTSPTDHFVLEKGIVTIITIILIFYLFRLTKKSPIDATTSESIDSQSSTPIPQSLDQSLLLSPLKLRSLTLKNRVIRAAAYGGNSIQAMIDTHVEVAKGGAGMTTLAYACVSNDGRTFASQMVLTNLSEIERQGLRTLCIGVHRHGCAISIQLTHGGGFSNHQVIGEQQKAPSNNFSMSNLSFNKEMISKDLERIVQDFREAAIVAQAIGFDCVEVHCGHGYLLAQFLSPSRNQRKSNDYGGPLYHSYPLHVIKNIREAVGSTFPIVVKFNVNDGFGSGLTTNHVSKFVQKLVNSNDVDMLVPSCGYVDQNGFHMLRGAVPYTQMIWAIPGCIEKFALCLFGRCLVPTIPFKRQFLRREAMLVLEDVRKAVGENIPVALLGGVRTWSGMENALAEGFGCIQTARTLIRDPNFVNTIKQELDRNCVSKTTTTTKKLPSLPRDVVSTCTNCNQCVVATLAEGQTMRCVLRTKGEDEHKTGASKLIDIEDLQGIVPKASSLHHHLGIFGATGRLGREILRQALAAGHSVSVLVRSAAKLEALFINEIILPERQRAKLNIIEGDARCNADVARLVNVCDHILFALGNTTTGTENLCTDVTRLVLPHLGISRRFIFCSGGSTEVLINDVPCDADTYGARFVRWWARMFMANSHNDKKNQMALVLLSQKEWYCVRPLQMGQYGVCQVHTGVYRLGYLPFNGMSQISFADCADAMLNMVTERTWRRCAPIIQY